MIKGVGRKNSPDVHVKWIRGIGIDSGPFRRLGGFPESERQRIHMLSKCPKLVAAVFVDEGYQRKYQGTTCSSWDASCDCMGRSNPVKIFPPKHCITLWFLSSIPPISRNTPPNNSLKAITIEFICYEGHFQRQSQNFNSQKVMS